MFFLCVLIVPHDCAAAFFDHSAINILTILFHNFADYLHPFLVLHFEEFSPLLLIVYEPVAALGGQPKVFLLHQVRIKDTRDLVAVSVRQDHHDVVSVVKDLLDPESYLCARAHFITT